MDSFEDGDFIKFLESFDEGYYEDEDGVKHYFHDSLRELSRSDTPPYDTIIDNDFPMYGLDWIAKASKKWKDTSKKCQRVPKLCRDKLPKTTDAIFCREGPEGNLILHVIEFKFVSDESNQNKLNSLYEDIIEKNNKLTTNQKTKCFNKKFVENFKSIKNDYIDSVENSLQLKPYEAVFIVLPELYDEYCEKKKKPKKDFKSYLYNMEKYYWVCIDSGTKNESNLQAQAKHFEKYYKRMEPVIFNEAVAKTKKDFNNCLKKVILP